MYTFDGFDFHTEYENDLDALMRLKELYTKEDLTEEEQREIRFINRYLEDSIIDNALEDETLCKEMLAFLNETGSDCNSLLFGAVGLAQRIIDLFSPNNNGCDKFHDWWIEPNYYNCVDMVDRAVIRAIDKRIAAETEVSE